MTRKNRRVEPLDARRRTSFDAMAERYDAARPGYPDALFRDILARTGLIAHANRPAGSLMLLEHKRLEMARALATAPELLLLDEIAGGLTERECQELIATIKDIRAAGTTIVWIEHIVHALLAVVDRLVVLNFGRKIAEGEPREVMGSREVGEIYMGLAI